MRLKENVYTSCHDRFLEGLRTYYLNNFGGNLFYNSILKGSIKINHQRLDLCWNSTTLFKNRPLTVLTVYK